MATDVTHLAKIMNGYKEDRTVGNESPAKSTALITRDLLGGGDSRNDLEELDLDKHVPAGWEKRLDLKTGKFYLQRHDSPNLSPSSTEYKHVTSLSKLQDMSISSSSSKSTSNHFGECNLELKLSSFPTKSETSSRSNYQSVCTLDKVKLALEEAEKDSIRKRSLSRETSSSSSISSSTSIKESLGENQNEDAPTPSVAIRCSRCWNYVMVAKNNPKCPRCCSITKKPRVDLNISI